MNRIQRKCEMCGQSFVPKTVKSVYCSKRCSDAAFRKKSLLKKKEEERKELMAKIPDDRSYISVPEATIIFGIAKSTLYRLIRQKKIPAINLGSRLVRIDRAEMEKLFPLTEQAPTTTKEKSKPKLYSLEPEDCYTIGEISNLFGISESSVHKHIRQYSIPTRQIGKYVYAPKSEIDLLYNTK